MGQYQMDLVKSVSFLNQQGASKKVRRETVLFISQKRQKEKKRKPNCILFEHEKMGFATMKKRSEKREINAVLADILQKQRSRIQGHRQFGKSEDSVKMLLIPSPTR
jgi:hypothetical protein